MNESDLFETLRIISEPCEWNRRSSTAFFGEIQKLDVKIENLTVLQILEARRKAMEVATWLNSL